MLHSNQPANRFYLGGARIAKFRNEPEKGDRTPEDWVASTTTVAGHQHLGLSTLPDGSLLLDSIRRNPLAWLGQRHLDHFGVDTRLLVKLLDAGQRLPVHAHPGTSFAQTHLGRAHGKAEAWYILSGGVVHLGLKERISRHDLLDLVHRQDVEALLALLHTRDVIPGDTVYVPPGVLHAIGAGTFLAEVQEPEDLSILLEWRDFDIDGSQEGHLGLGFETALGALELSERSDREISKLVSRGASGISILPEMSREFFTLSHHFVDGPVTLDQGFSVIIVTEGEVELHCASMDTLVLPSGSTCVAPFDSGPLEINGHGEIVVCGPPVPAPTSDLDAISRAARITLPQAQDSLG